MMSFLGYGVVLVGFLVVLGEGRRLNTVAPPPEGERFITWDDLKLGSDGFGLDLEVVMREDGNGSRIIVVDQNGKGDVSTVQGAVDLVPEHNSQRIKICILPGIYREKVHVPASKPYISFIGDANDPSKTVISWHDKASDSYGNGTELGTSRTATVQVFASYFCATGITVENTVVAVPGGEGMQAVAMNINGDRAVFYKCRFLGSQDTLLDDIGVHYFYQCYIEGMIDFICGNARSLYQDCVINSVGSGAIAAQHRNSASENTGYSFVNCKITGNGRTLLGRAWGEFSRVVYAKCDIDGVILPCGWGDWNIPSRQRNSVFAEYQNRGPGANRDGRVPWMKSLSDTEARQYMDTAFIEGEQWLRL
nr:pectinesterase QRT1 [Ipomoea batatas]